MRKIAVIGLSTFGVALVKALAKERCRVLAFDSEERRVNAVREYAEEAVIGDASDPRAFESLRLQDYDAVVLSLGEPLDASLLAVLHLRDLKVRRIVCKAESEDHRRLLKALGVEQVVFPEADMAERTAHTLASASLLESFHIGNDVAVVEVAPPKATIGRTLGELELPQNHRITVVAIRDALSGELRVTPAPTVQIKDSDSLIVVGRDDDVDRFSKKG